jgi:hypothetical protein
MVEMRHVYEIVVGEPERKTKPGRPRRRWVNNNQMDLKEKKVRGC